MSVAILFTTSWGLEKIAPTNHCTVLAQTNQALCDIICSRMNTINVIENGGAGNSLHTYIQICFLCKAAPLRRQIQKTSSSNTRSKTPGTMAVITVLTYRFVDWMTTALLQTEPLFLFVSSADISRAKSLENDHLLITRTALIDPPNWKVMQDRTMILH